MNEVYESLGNDTLIVDCYDVKEKSKKRAFGKRFQLREKFLSQKERFQSVFFFELTCLYEQQNCQQNISILTIRFFSTYIRGLESLGKNQMKSKFCSSSVKP